MPIDLWYTDHRNLAQVADFMNKKGETIENIIYMLEKPWKYDDTFARSDAMLDAEIQALK